MKESKGTRKPNRTHDEIRAALTAKIAYHNAQTEQFAARLAALDAPKQPRKSKVSYNKAFAEVKAAGITPEEILKILSERKEAATA
jgi:hypothetical protein